MRTTANMVSNCEKLVLTFLLPFSEFQARVVRRTASDMADGEAMGLQMDTSETEGQRAALGELKGRGKHGKVAVNRATHTAGKDCIKTHWTYLLRGHIWDLCWEPLGPLHVALTQNTGVSRFIFSLVLNITSFRDCQRTQVRFNPAHTDQYWTGFYGVHRWECCSWSPPPSDRGVGLCSQQRHVQRKSAETRSVE